MVSLVDMILKHVADSEADTARKSRSFAGAFWFVFLCTAVLAGHAMGQTCPPRSPGEPACGGSSAHEDVPMIPVPHFELDPGLIPVLEEDGLVMYEDDQGPSSRWYCFEPVSEVEPVWRGTPFKHTFEYCNVGTAPMRVRIEPG